MGYVTEAEKAGGGIALVMQLLAGLGVRLGCQVAV
jgi:hypothetical protein